MSGCKANSVIRPGPEVHWSELGYDGAKLGYLLAQNGWFHRGHRAVDDCYATLEVLAAEPQAQSGSALGRLLGSEPNQAIAFVS